MRWFKTLSPKLQRIVIDGLVEMGKIEDRYQAADEGELQRKLKDKGMIFNPVDLPKFHEALKELPNQFKDKWKPGFAEQVKAVR